MKVTQLVDIWQGHPHLAFEVMKHLPVNHLQKLAQFSDKAGVMVTDYSLCGSSDEDRERQRQDYQRDLWLHEQDFEIKNSVRLGYNPKQHHMVITGFKAIHDAAGIVVFVGTRSEAAAKIFFFDDMFQKRTITLDREDYPHPAIQVFAQLVVVLHDGNPGQWCGTVFSRKTGQKLYTVSRPLAIGMMSESIDDAYVLKCQSDRMAIWKLTERCEMHVYDQPKCCGRFANLRRIAKDGLIVTLCSRCKELRKVDMETKEVIWKKCLSGWLHGSLHCTSIEITAGIITLLLEGLRINKVYGFLCLECRSGEVVPIAQEYDSLGLNLIVTDNFIIISWFCCTWQRLSIFDRMTNRQKMTRLPRPQDVRRYRLEMVDPSILVTIPNEKNFLPETPSLEIVGINLAEEEGPVANPANLIRFNLPLANYTVLSGLNGFFGQHSSIGEIQLSTVMFKGLGTTKEEFAKSLLQIPFHKEEESPDMPVAEEITAMMT